MTIIISLAQMNIKLRNPAVNLEKCISMIKEASKRGSDLVLLPELWSTGYDLSNASQYINDNQLILQKLQNIAKELRINIGGSFLETINNQHYNTFIYILSDGTINKDYQKIHLFRLMDEHLWLTGGNQLHMRKFSWGICTQAICYDLRFSEIFRNYAINGAQIVFVSAEWPLARLSHWKTLLRARAIENQLFIAAVNCVGKTGEETFGGNSVIINPWGEAVVEAGEIEDELVTSEIDLNEIEKVRNQIPILSDRRPDVYDNEPIIE